MRVLLVDDNEINLEIQRYMLEGCELDVDTAESGETAIGLAENESYDMIFMDIQMPGMDGFEAARRIRCVRKDVPIIALSADKISYDDQRFISSGMNGSIRKPLQQNALSELLSGYLHIEQKEQSAENSDSVFDVDGFRALIPDDGSAAQILEQFFSVHGCDSDLLRERIGSGNILGARELMHDIVGISGNLYCHRLYGVSVRLGAELRQGRSDSLEEFISVWEETLGELRTYCEGLDTVGEEVGEDVSWDVLWDDFLSLCRELDVYAVKLFRRNTAVFAENLGEDEFERIKAAVAGYDFLSIIAR